MTTKNSKNLPLISVIMPVYNGMPYLKQAIRSIQDQTYKNWELICIDDCSTDGSLASMLAFARKDKRIRIFKNSTKKYLSGSLNFALVKVRGKYIARMDADDISLPNRFDLQLKLLESNRDLVAVGGWEEIIDESGDVLGVKTFPSDSKKCYRLLMNMMPVQPPLLMARASVMKKLRYDTGISKHDDIDMHLKLTQFGNFSNVEEVIFSYRKRMNSYTFSNVKKVFFMALFVRLRAIFKYNFRPHWSSLLVCLSQIILVLVLPSSLIIKLFELLRLSPEKTRSSSIALAPAIQS